MFQNIFYNSAASESMKARGPGGPDMKTQRGMGGVVSNVRFVNITGGLSQSAASITMCHHNWAVGVKPTPKWINISFKDIDLEVASLGLFEGLPESPIQNLSFSNVTFRLAKTADNGSKTVGHAKSSPTWECTKCFDKLYATGTATGLSPPLTGKCALSPL